MPNTFLTNIGSGQPTYNTNSSIGYGGDTATPLTINSTAGVQFCNNGTTQLGNSCSISSAGIFNCNGLTISGPLTCSSIIIPNGGGTIACLGTLICSSTLNMNSNAISNVGGLAITSGGLSCVGGLNMNSNAISNVGGLSCVGTLNMNSSAITHVGALTCSARPFQWIMSSAIGSNGTTIAGDHIGAMNTQTTGFSQVNVYGGASASAWSTAQANFTAPTDGMYHFQLNIYNNGGTNGGRNIMMSTSGVLGSAQYCTFNVQPTSADWVYNWTQMMWLSAGDLAYFHNPSGANLILYYAAAHTTLSIIRIY